jgi:hypothetical protein
MNEQHVWVRCQWHDWRRGKVLLSNLQGLHWCSHSGAAEGPASRRFIHGYINCNQILEGEVAHSCSQEGRPHRIRVSIVRKDNPKTFEKIRALVEETGGFHRHPRRSARGS